MIARRLNPAPGDLRLLRPTVYLDGQLYGLVGILKQIPSAQVAEIRLYRAWEAATKYGEGNMGGVIAIATRR